MNDSEKFYKYKKYIHGLFLSQENFECSSIYNLSTNIANIISSKKVSNIIEKVNIDFYNDTITFYFVDQYIFDAEVYIRDQLVKVISECALYTKSVLYKYIDFESEQDFNDFIDWISTTDYVMNEYVVGSILSFRL